MHEGSAPSRIDPDRVMEAVELGLQEATVQPGVTVHVEVIEYVPNDSPYYEAYTNLSRRLALWIVTGKVPTSPTPSVEPDKA